jgi:anti-sigma B factor antagonist
MNTAPAKMWVLAGEHFACVKISGRATFSSSIDFKTLVQELRQRGCTYFVLDLSECTLMDSTFLGVLSGFGLQSTTQKPGQLCVVFELLNPNERITELLESLGVLHLFKLAHGTAQVPETTEAFSLPPACPSKEDIRRACLEAHQTLMQINPQNASKFKEVATFLAEDLKKPRPAG